MRIMLSLREWFCQRIRNVQIRVYFAYLDLTPVNEVSNEMKSPHYVFVLLVVPWLLCLRNCPIVITVEIQWAGRIREHTKLNEEIPNPNTFLRGFRSRDVLGFRRRIGHHLLLGTLPTNSTTIQCEHKS